MRFIIIFLKLSSNGANVSLVIQGSQYTSNKDLVYIGVPVAVFHIKKKGAR